MDYLSGLPSEMLDIIGRATIYHDGTQRRRAEDIGNMRLVCKRLADQLLYTQASAFFRDLYVEVGVPRSHIRLQHITLDPRIRGLVHSIRLVLGDSYIKTPGFIVEARQTIDTVVNGFYVTDLALALRHMSRCRSITIEAALAAGPQHPLITPEYVTGNVLRVIAMSHAEIETFQLMLPVSLGMDWVALFLESGLCSHFNCPSIKTMDLSFTLDSNMVLNGELARSPLAILDQQEASHICPPPVPPITHPNINTNLHGRLVQKFLRHFPNLDDLTLSPAAGVLDWDPMWFPSTLATMELHLADAPAWPRLYIALSTAPQLRDVFIEDGAFANFGRPSVLDGIRLPATVQEVMLRNNVLSDADELGAALTNLPRLEHLELVSIAFASMWSFKFFLADVRNIRSLRELEIVAAFVGVPGEPELQEVFYETQCPGTTGACEGNSWRCDNPRDDIQDCIDDAHVHRNPEPEPEPQSEADEDSWEDIDSEDGGNGGGGDIRYSPEQHENSMVGRVHTMFQQLRARMGYQENPTDRDAQHMLQQQQARLVAPRNPMIVHMRAMFREAQNLMRLHQNARPERENPIVDELHDMFQRAQAPLAEQGNPIRRLLEAQNVLSYDDDDYTEEFWAMDPGDAMYVIRDMRFMFEQAEPLFNRDNPEQTLRDLENLYEQSLLEADY